jgi:hypothetical protein
VRDCVSELEAQLEAAEARISQLEAELLSLSRAIRRSLLDAKRKPKVLETASRQA